MGERYPHCSCVAPLDSHRNTLHQKLQGAWLSSLSPDIYEYSEMAVPVSAYMLHLCSC